MESPLRREQIAEAALTLVVQHGLGAVTVRRVAEAVGISAAALYRHYKNKADILQVVLEEHQEMHMAELRKALAQAKSPLDALRLHYESAMVTTKGRLLSPEEFANIILRAQPDGSLLRLRDVARVELGAKDYKSQSKLSGNPSVSMGIYLSPGANALETADRVTAKLAELSKRFPDGISYKVPLDTTTFVRVSIEEVIHTLVEAMDSTLIAAEVIDELAKAAGVGREVSAITESAMLSER